MKQSTTILIIEDNALNLEMARDLLLHSGYKVLEATQALSGIELAKAHQPELILMDIHLPQMDGYQATAYLKADPTTAHIPVVAYTALAMPADQQRALEVGCDGLISKPIDIQGFLQQIARYLEQPAKPPAKVASGLPESATLKAEPNSSSQTKGEFEEFLHIASHDLQAPLRKIIKFSELLRLSLEPRLTDHELHLLGGIDRSADILYQYLQDLLALSRVDQKPLKCSSIDWSSLLARVRDQVLEALPDAETAEWEIASLPPVMAQADQLHLVMMALLKNAVQYRDVARPLTIQLSGRIMPDGGTQVRVQDTGSGFPLEYQERIFKPFERLHRNNQVPGSGMGLSLAQRIMARHGGRISVDSAVGVGSTFTLHFPPSQP